MSAVRRLLLVVALFLVAAPAAEAADILGVGSQSRLTRVGPDGNNSVDANDPAVAYNSQDDEFLIAWVGSTTVGGDVEIFGQVLTGNGVPKGPVNRLTNVTTGSPAQPVLSYSPTTNQYVLGYIGPPPASGDRSDNAPAGQREVMAQAVTATGVALLNPFRMSSTDPDPEPQPIDADAASDPAIAYDPERDQFRFVWVSDSDIEAQIEVRTQRVSSSLVNLFGEVAVSSTTSTGAADDPAVAFLPGQDGWMVVWEEVFAGAGTEIVARRLSLASAPQGSDLTISASSGSTSSLKPSVASRSSNDETLVAFTRSDVAGEGPEVFVQRLNAGGTQIPNAVDQRISTMGPAGNPGYGASTSARTTVTYHPLLDRYLVTWSADNDLPGLVDNEIERYGQALDPNGAEVLADDFRISNAGPDGNDNATALDGATAVVPGRRAWFHVWEADDNRPPLADNEFELYGRFAGDDGDLDGHAPPEDCDDANAAVHPGAVDILDNGIDEDCTGTFAENPDRDRDGSPRPADCNDGNAGVRPGAADAPDNGVDEDCSGADAVNLDRDGDGAARPGDCNDGNPAIRPGAKDTPRNGVDEDCAGGDASFQNLTSGILPTWRVNGSRLTLVNLQITQQFPKGLKARITCKGSRCPFKSKALKLGKVRRNSARAISSLSSKQRKFRAGQTLEIWLMAPGFNSRISRLRLKARKIPVSQPFCALPGTSKVQKRCT